MQAGVAEKSTFYYRAICTYRHMLKASSKLPVPMRHKTKSNIRDSFIIIRSSNLLTQEQREEFLSSAQQDLQLIKKFVALPEHLQQLLDKRAYHDLLYQPKRQTPIKHSTEMPLVKDTPHAFNLFNERRSNKM